MDRQRRHIIVSVRRIEKQLKETKYLITAHLFEALVFNVHVLIYFTVVHSYNNNN